MVEKQKFTCVITVYNMRNCNCKTGPLLQIKIIGAKVWTLPFCRHTIPRDVGIIERKLHLYPRREGILDYIFTGTQSFITILAYIQLKNFGYFYIFTFDWLVPDKQCPINNFNLQQGIFYFQYGFETNLYPRDQNRFKAILEKCVMQTILFEY